MEFWWKCGGQPGDIVNHGDSEEGRFAFTFDSIGREYSAAETDDGTVVVASYSTLATDSWTHVEVMIAGSSIVRWNTDVVLESSAALSVASQLSRNCASWDISGVDPTAVSSRAAFRLSQCIRYAAQYCPPRLLRPHTKINLLFMSEQPTLAVGNEGFGSRLLDSSLHSHHGVARMPGYTGDVL